MKRKHILFITMLVLFCLVGGMSLLTGSRMEQLPQKVYEVGVDRLPYRDEEIYQQLFDLNNKIKVDIRMSDRELQKLQSDYDRYRDMGSKSPIYRMANVTVTVTTDRDTTVYRISEVGVRMKGNTSRTAFYDPETGIYNHIHFKLDFSQTFDDVEDYGADTKVWASEGARKLRKNRTFAMLEKLEVRWNKCADSTYLKEAYAYSLYRSEGVLAPMVSLCSLDWSGNHMGIYTIAEPVDELFLEKRLPEEALGGDLYKLGWSWEGAAFNSTASIGIENENKGEFYAYDLKTNKKTSDHASLIELIEELNSGTMTKERFAQLVDTEQFLRYAAVSYFLGNPDDLRNNYNNSYIYFMKNTGKMVVIPYDTDRCLGIVHEWDPTGNGVTRDSPFTGERAAGGRQRSPLYLYTVVEGGWYTSEFQQVLEEVAGNTLLQPDTFEAVFYKVAALYDGEAEPSRRMDNAGDRSYAFGLGSGFGGNLSFRDYISAKMATYRSPAEEEAIIWECYVRGSFNDWSLKESYRMQQSGAVLIFDLRLSKGFEFKIYDNDTDAWYGTEIVTPETKVSYTSSREHGNVVLPAGSYRLYYDPITRRLTIEEIV